MNREIEELLKKAEETKRMIEEARELLDACEARLQEEDEEEEEDEEGGGYLRDDPEDEADWIIIF